MIDTNEAGQRKLERLLGYIDSFNWTDFERGFLQNMSDQGHEYLELTSKQKSMVGRLYDKWLGVR